MKKIKYKYHTSIFEKKYVQKAYYSGSFPGR